MAKLLTVKDVAGQLAVSRSTVYKMLDGGVFPPAPIRLPNGSPRWPQEAVDEWVEVHRCDRRDEEPSPASGQRRRGRSRLDGAAESGLPRRT